MWTIYIFFMSLSLILILLYDNSQPHVARMTLQKFIDLWYETFLHPTYFPDFSTTDYNFFKHSYTKKHSIPKEKMKLNWKSFFHTGINNLVYQCPWCNGYRHRKWTRRHKFKSWMRLIAFHIALIPLGKVWIQLFSLQLWVNSRTDWVLQPWWGN